MNIQFIKRNKILLLVIAAFSLFSIAGCARKLTFQQSVIVPAATGKVKVKKDKNNNYSIDINIDNLAPADKLTPSKKLYLVWMETSDHSVKNLGQLKSSSGFLSSKLKASLSTVTPFKPEKIFVTGENDASLSYPEGDRVLTTN